jgi:hypothetical protein
MIELAHSTLVTFGMLVEQELLLLVSKRESTVRMSQFYH